MKSKTCDNACILGLHFLDDLTMGGGGAKASIVSPSGCTTTDVEYGCVSFMRTLEKICMPKKYACLIKVTLFCNNYNENLIFESFRFQFLVLQPALTKNIFY